jgi:hypothetical protein
MQSAETHSVEQHLRALARADFASPECFWRRGPVAVYEGVR